MREQLTCSVSHITNQGSGKMNEDVLLIESRRFAVFDGASSLVPYVSSDGKTGGRMAADLAYDTFRQNSDEELRATALLTNTAIRTAEQRARIDMRQKEALWGTTIAAVQMTPHGRMDWLTIGNSSILVVYADGSHETLGHEDNHDLPTLKMWQKLAAQNAVDPWETLRSQNVKVRQDVNKTYGYINGEPQAERFMSVGQLVLRSANPVESVVLLSDGLLISKEDPEAPENWRLFARLLRQGGLRRILQHVRTIESDDPHARTYPRLKRHDDASAIALEFRVHS
jgi:hypothetical protein